MDAASNPTREVKGHIFFYKLNGQMRLAATLALLAIDVKAASP
jgi:hypothetical protein